MRERIEAYYITNRDKMIKRVKNSVGGEYNAEDCVQMAFEQALTYDYSFNPAYSSFDTWMNNIFNNSVKRFKSEERKQGMSVELKEDLLVDEKDRYADKDMVKFIEADIEKEENRQILWLYFIKGIKPKDVSAITDINLETVKKAVYRFKQKMKEKYG